MASQYNIQGTDLQIGMYLNDTGTTPISVYYDADTTSGVLLTIQPGEQIGQIHDFKYSNGENWVVFNSGAITSAHPWYAKLGAGSLDALLPGKMLYVAWDKTANVLSLYGYVRLADLQGLSVADIQKQATMLAADPNGTNAILAAVKQTASAAGQVTATALKSALDGLTSGGFSGLTFGIVALLAYLALTRGGYSRKGGFSYK